MNLVSELGLPLDIQLLIPCLLILTYYLRQTPKIKNWTIQWIILIVSIASSIFNNGLTFQAINTGVFAAMAVTYITHGFINKKEERLLSELACNCSSYKEQLDQLANDINESSK